MACLLGTGNTPGWARQIGQVWTLGSSPKESSQPQNIFVLVASWTWISSPITASSSATDALRSCIEADPLLQREGGVEQLLLAEGRRGDLEADRQPRAAPLGLGEPDRDRDRRDAGEAHRHREEVVEVHRERVGGLLPEAEGNRGRSRGDDEVDLGE